MENLTLELNIYSAKDLENVNLITKMDVYAVVSINGDDSRKNEKEKTPIDRTGESEPTWNHAVKFSVDQRLAYEGRLTLVVKLVCDRGIFGDKDLGEVQVPVLELLHGSTPSPSFNRNGQGMMRFVTYQVRTPFGKGQGSLTFSYRFNTPSFEPDSSVSSSSPVYTNPIHTPPDLPATTTTMSYPPPPSSEASFYPPLSSIEHPPSSQPQGYSAPPYPYPNPNPYQYNSHYPAQPINIYPPPPSPSASNIYPPPYYSTSPPQHQSYPPPPRHSYHQTQPTHSFHGYAPSSPQNHHGCIYPPPSPSTHNRHGCVYPPSPPTTRYGYGSPTTTTQTPQKNNNKTGLGLGMGAGLLGGALGGLLLGDLVSDIGFDL